MYNIFEIIMVISEVGNSGSKEPVLLAFSNPFVSVCSVGSLIIFIYSIFCGGLM